MTDVLRFVTKTHLIAANSVTKEVTVSFLPPRYNTVIPHIYSFQWFLSLLDNVYLGDGEGIVAKDVYGLKVDEAESLAKFITNSLYPPEEQEEVIELQADLLPANALLEVVNVLTTGKERYPDDKWKTQTIQQHLSHALLHIFKYFQGDKTEPHLSHAATRLLFALEIQQQKGDK